MVKTKNSCFRIEEGFGVWRLVSVPSMMGPRKSIVGL